MIKCIKKGKYDDNLEEIVSLYQCDIDSERLKVHLKILSTNFQGKRDTVSIFDVKDCVLSLSPNERLIISEVCVLCYKKGLTIYLYFMFIKNTQIIWT